MRLCVLLLVLMAAQPLPGQFPVDSLNRELRRLERVRPGFARDTSRVSLLCQLAKQTKEWQAARVYWQHAVDVAEKADWAAGKLEVYRGMGRHYVKKSLYAEATHCYYRGLNLAEKTGNKPYQVEVYRVLGVAFDLAGNHAKARLQYAKSADIAKKLGSKYGYLHALNSTGSSYYRAKEYDRALYYFNRCIRENNPLDSVQQCWFLTNVAATYRDKRQYDSAAVTYQALLRYGKHLQSPDSAYAYADLAMTNARIKKTKIALFYSQKALAMVPRLTGGFTISHVYEAASEVCQARGEDKQAFRFYRQYITIRDSALHQGEQQRVEGLRMVYENEKQRADLTRGQERETEQRRSNRLLWTGIGLLGLLGVGLIATNYLLRRRGQEIEQQRSEIGNLNASLEKRVAERTSELQLANETLLRKNQEIEEALFKGQSLERKRVASELHDNLGGTLAAIKWKVEAMVLNAPEGRERKIYEEVYRMIKEAYGEVRLLSHNFMPAILEKEGLEQAFESLAEQINKSGRMKLTVQTEPVSALLDAQQRLELYSVGMELITNVLKHAQATECQVVLICEAGGILLSVTDNGIGLPLEEAGKGIGLQNIETRVKAISGNWSIQTKPNDGTSVIIRVPVPALVLAAENSQPFLKSQIPPMPVR